MSNVVSALTNSTTGLTVSKLLSSIIDLVPFLVIIVPVALGLFLLGRILKEYLTGQYW